jgi:CBS domain-containing protein
VDTSAIAYRVADFLKQHPPFESIPSTDLRELAASGRVRFFEPNEFILWQGEPHKAYVFVIQQGTVSLWDDSASGSVLHDVRGAGDLLGIERFLDAPSCLYSATSSTDVVIYALRSEEFERIVLSHASARRFVEAYDTVAGAAPSAAFAREPQHITVDALLPGGRVETIAASASLQQVARLLVNSGADAIALLEDDGSVCSLVTMETIVACVGRGVGAGDPAAHADAGTLPSVSGTTSVADAALVIAGSPAATISITGGVGKPTPAIIGHRQIRRVFGDDPVSIVRELRVAPDRPALRELNLRARALALRHSSDSASVEWIERLISLADTELVRRLFALEGVDADRTCWCFCGTAGRAERLTAHAPDLLIIAADDLSTTGLRDQHERIREAFAECGYAAKSDTPFDAAFQVASLGEWQSRYTAWLREPVPTQMYRARPLFDLRAVYGDSALWSAVAACVAANIDASFLLVLANDCMSNMPPLTFFQDAVLDTAGEQTAVFKLEESALQPLVDVGRVFGLATGHVVGTSTVERLRHAAAQHPEHESVFAEAAETFRLLLRQQARIGISQGTSGSELPPSVLSRHDRQLLKSGFRSILALLEFTRGAFWLESA